MSDPHNLKIWLRFCTQGYCHFIQKKLKLVKKILNFARNETLLSIYPTHIASDKVDRGKKNTSLTHVI